jgi:hypothetical protein
MNKKICITSSQAAGCTFVDWSIHFLSGQSNYFNVVENQWIDIIQNPVNVINAHGHKKNHPDGCINTQQYLNKFDSMPGSAIYSVYSAPLTLDFAAKQLNIDINQIDSDLNAFNHIKQYVINDYNKMFDLCHSTQTKIVYVDVDPATALYHTEFRNLNRFLTKPDKPNSINELEDEFQEIFFKTSQTQWKELDLTDVWDIREKLALNTRPFEILYNNFKFEKIYPHHWINCSVLWTHTAKTITKLMKYLELEIDSDRFKSWIPICQQWQHRQLDLVEFCYIQPHIVDAIVHNLYYEIDLTFKQEVIIQHCLIYQHGLNLKTWQLKKFPNNTQDLHKLLELNIHPVPDIYSRLATQVC